MNLIRADCAATLKSTGSPSRLLRVRKVSRALRTSASLSTPGSDRMCSYSIRSKAVISIRSPLTIPLAAFRPQRPTSIPQTAFCAILRSFRATARNDPDYTAINHIA